MEKYDCVNIFLSEGAGLKTIINETEKEGGTILRDAFGHVRLDDINPGQWFAKQFSEKLSADKVLVQKSGYFSRSSNPNKKDLDLIFKTVDYAVMCALDGKSGVVGLDNENNNKMSCIDFNRIKGGKSFDPTIEWFTSMIDEIK